MLPRTPALTLFCSAGNHLTCGVIGGWCPTWLEEKLGIVVPELGHERSESTPFGEQPSKWEGQPKSASQLPMLFSTAVV